MKFILLIAIILACVGITALELHDAHQPAALAFFGFAIGYAGLAWLYWPFP
jgi:hypothetical protein